MLREFRTSPVRGVLVTGLPFPTAPSAMGSLEPCKYWRVKEQVQRLPSCPNTSLLSLSCVTGIPECQTSLKGKSCSGEAVQKSAWKFPHPLLCLLQSSGVSKCGEIPVGRNVKCVFVWSWDGCVFVWVRSFGSRAVFLCVRSVLWCVGDFRREVAVAAIGVSPTGSRAAFSALLS